MYIHITELCMYSYIPASRREPGANVERGERDRIVSAREATAAEESVYTQGG
jgi:uncharacterized DUF497 family protein